MEAKIPLFRPQAEIERCQLGVTLALARVLASGTYVNGPEGERFEAACARWCGAPYAVGVSSGTAALELMLRADGVGPGRRVVLTSHTFVAVLEAVLAIGAEPVLVDLDPDTWQMPSGHWPDDCVMACHLYGGASAAVGSRCERLYEDASQSFGASLEGRPVGTFARAGVVSCYPTKNLSAAGDAGLVLTADAALAGRIRAMRNHGQTAPQVHELRGTTARLDELQAAMLAEKLLLLPTFLEERRRAAEWYREALADLPLAMPRLLPGSVEAPNLFVVRTPRRDHLRDHLRRQGIATGVHYPTPLHLMPAYRDRPWSQVRLPHAETLCVETLTLPLWAGISRDEQAAVIESVRGFFGSAGRAAR